MFSSRESSLPRDKTHVSLTTRPFRYDLNQIPYDYTVEVRTRFKGLDLIDRVLDELWNEVPAPEGNTEGPGTASSEPLLPS